MKKTLTKAVVASAVVASSVVGVGHGANTGLDPVDRALDRAVSIERAEAWPSSSHVNVQGRARCGRWGPGANAIWYQTSNDDRGWARILDHHGNYRISLRNVPGGSGTWMSVSYTCPGKGWKTTGFGVARPWWGKTQTRNIY